jgi:hypothetical protein
MRAITGICIGSLLALFSLSCDYIEGLTSEGVPIEKKVYFEGIKGIEVWASVKILLVKSDEDSITLSGPDFNVEKIKFKQEGEKLVIDAKHSGFFRKEQLVEIRMPVKSLNKIYLEVPVITDCEEQIQVNDLTLIVAGSAAYSESDLNIKANRLTIAVYGANVGLHKIKGEVNQFNVTAEGISEIDGLDLKCQKLHVNQRSENDLLLNASVSMKVNMYSSGNVYYTGQPEIEYQTINPGWDVEYGKVIAFQDR